MNRRGFLLGVGAALAAPAIVRYESIMPVRNRLVRPLLLRVNQQPGIIPKAMTFSCYLKPDNGLRPELAPSDSLQTLCDAGNGWYRWTVGLTGEHAQVLIPGVMWGAQVDGDCRNGLSLEFKHPDHDKGIWLINEGDGPTFGTAKRG